MEVIMINGWYYLHTNGSLIYRDNLPGMAADIRESDLAVMLWPVDTGNRESAWGILVEALACNADINRIKELAVKWQCDDNDAQIYAQRVGVQLFMEGDQWGATKEDFINLQESPAGFGSTALEAMAALCKELGYKPRKTWGSHFTDLLK